MKKTILISFPLMVILNLWISTLLWIDFNPGTIGRIIGLSTGIITGSIVILIIAFYEKKEALLNKGITNDERSIIIHQKSAYATTAAYSMLLLAAGILSTILANTGFPAFKTVSYTIMFALALFVAVKGICFLFVSQRY